MFKTYFVKKNVLYQSHELLKLKLDLIFIHYMELEVTSLLLLLLKKKTYLIN